MDESLTPDKILFRLEELRKWQKIQEQRLLEQQISQRRTLTEAQSKIYHQLNKENQIESYNDFSKSSSNILCEDVTRVDSDVETDYYLNPGDSFSSKTSRRDLMLNLSNESEPYCTPTPQSETVDNLPTYDSNKLEEITYRQQDVKNGAHIMRNCINSTKIRLEEVPIIPSKDFKTILEDNLKNEKPPKISPGKNKKPTKKYLKRGEGMARFKLTSNDIGLNANKKLPWRKKKSHVNTIENKKNVVTQDRSSKINDGPLKPVLEKSQKAESKKKLDFPNKVHDYHTSDINIIDSKYEDALQYPGGSCVVEISDKYSNKTLSPERPTTWASVFNNDQEKIMALFKQTGLYQDYLECPENYMSDTSASMSPSMNKFKTIKEAAEQNMFDLLEKKVDNASFCSSSSFICKVIGNTGNTTPNLNKEYVKTNPRVLNLKPSLAELKTIEHLNSSKESIADDSGNFQYLNEFKSKGLASHMTTDCTANEDTDEYTESTDTEETCKIGINHLISTSTPNQPQNIEKVLNKKNKCEEMAADRKGKIIEIILRSDNTDDLTIDRVKNISDYDKTVTQEASKGEVDDAVIFSDLQYDSDAKTELLKSRLAELVSQIEIFRKENECINVMKNEILKEKEDFLKEKAEIERKINEDKTIAEYYLAEEKEKLAKQKLMYDRHVKDMKGQSLKKDREEISLLKRELNDLRQQITAKDAKTGAFHARLRNQIKNLERENDELHEENEKLKKENKKILNSNARTRRLSNIKSLAEINKSLAQFTIDNKMVEVEIEDVYPVKSISSEYLVDDKIGSRSGSSSQRKNKPTVLRHRAKSVPNLSTATSRYAKYFSKRDEKLKLECNTDFNSEENSNDSDSDTEEKIYLPADDFTRNSSGSIDDALLTDRHKNDHTVKDDKVKDILLTKPKLNAYGNENLIEKMYMEKFNRITENDVTQSNVQETIFNKNEGGTVPASGRSTREEKSKIIRPDGSREIRFENGNTNIVSADGSYSKFTYYNGDIKETFYKEGMIKYFYKEANTYHTTYKDGSQVLQFPDGHLERRYKDGSIQAHLPGGATRWTRPDGNEEWRFPDGTLVMVNSNGEQTLRFPNGQTEIHTHDHKRREFPDGTVKVVYADGVVETRYANGRIRVKDKRGNLVMDSAVRHNVESTPHTAFPH